MLTALRHWFAYPWLLWSLLALPALGVLVWLARARRRRALFLLGGLAALEAQLQARRGRRLMRGIWLTLGLALVGVAAAGPQWGRDWEQPTAPGRDLVVVLDCSRSMFAEVPSRLERARVALLDLCDPLEKRGGQRIGLVLCAARARLVCPLTHDCDHVRELLGRLDELIETSDLGPGPGDVSGTRVAAGVAEAVAAHDPRYRGSQDILLLSDGDDPVHDGEWQRAADIARDADVPVFVVGLGDPDTASTVPGDDGPLRHQGREVRTQLVEAPLRAIAQATHGRYIGARTLGLPLGSVYLDDLAGTAQRDEADDSLPALRPRYSLFLLMALSFLAGGLTLADRKPRRPRAESRDT